MHSSAGDITALLDADLIVNGWDGSVEPKSDDSAKVFAMKALRRSLFKKFHNLEGDDARNELAWAKFMEMNNRCATYQSFRSRTDNKLEEVAMNEAMCFIYRFCHPDEMPLLTLKSIEQGLGFGSGANIGAKTGDPYGKLAISRLTYTNPALLKLYEHTNSGNWTMFYQELHRASNYGTEEVQGSRISFVPKDQRITRTICTEPILNMYFQKGIAHVLEKRLRQVVGIDLHNQPERNRRLCRYGSVTGEIGTIDLTSASDSLSMQLVSEVFPDHMVRWLERTRCEQTLYNGEWHRLHMVSSMGNAFTFPLQTIYFTSLVVGAYRSLGIKPRYNSRITSFGSDVAHCKVHRLESTTDGNFAVFGDDILVVREAYDLVVRLLEISGFLVNHEKSFNSGGFRESCGHDYFNGYNVRGVYIKKLRDDLDYYSAYNRLQRWSVRHEITLIRTLSYISAKPSKALIAPCDEDDEAGFHVPYSFARLVLPVKSGVVKYVAAYRVPSVVKFPKSAFDVKDTLRVQRRVKGWTYNPSGVLNLLMLGGIRDGLWTLRSESSKIGYRKRRTPCWDTPSYASSVKTKCWHDFYASLLQGLFTKP